MFTGIIKNIGKVEKSQKKAGSLFLLISPQKKWKIKRGSSVAVDGACLTVQDAQKNWLVFELMPETLRKTTFGRKIPKQVNLEKSLTLNSFLDGHLVLGHIDSVGKITGIKSEFSSKIYSVSFPKKYRQLIVKKGSIAINGVSLTVVKVFKDYFTVALLEYTLLNTTFKEKKVGDLVNVEFDILAKYACNDKFKSLK